MLAEYRRLYPGSYMPKRFQDRVQGSVAGLKRAVGLLDQPARSASVLQQLQLEL